MGHALSQDIRYALRMMTRAPGFTAVAVLCLALGVGATTAVFTLIDGVMFRPLPVREPGQIVELLSLYPGEPRMNAFWWKFYEHYRDQNHVFSDLIGSSPARFQIAVEGSEPEPVDGDYIVGRFFPALGVQPAIGRLIAEEDDRLSTNAAVAVVSWAYWQSRWQLSPTVIGSRIVVDGAPASVIGVTPREFTGLLPGRSPRVWVPSAFEPLAHQPSRRAEGQLQLQLVGRLKPGVTRAQAEAEIKLLDRVRVEELATRSRDPQWRLSQIEVRSAGAGLSVLRDALAQPLLALMAIVSLLMLITCTNVAGMLLARAAARRREIAVRIALGAARWRLIRQLLVESLLLSIPGGMLGMLLATAGATMLARAWPLDPRLKGRVEIPVYLDTRVLLFSIAVVAATTALFGLAPAWRGFDRDQPSSLRQGAVSGESRRRRYVGRALVAGQMALSVVLLTSAGLFVGEVLSLRYRDLGFEPDSVLLVTLNPAGRGLSAEQLAPRYEALLGRLQAISGVTAATLCGVSPIEGGAASRFVNVPGFAEPTDSRRYVSLNWVAPAYFDVVRTPLVSGRDFSASDTRGPRVAIVNRAFARYYFGDSAAIGRRFTFDGQTDSYEIVGVAGDAKYSTLHEPPPRTVYLNGLQDNRGRSRQFAIRTSGAPSATAGEVRRAVAEELPAVPIAKVTTLAEQVDASLMPERLMARLASVFGAAGLVLAALGLYGLMAFMVTQRTREIALRMACGATRSNAVAIVIRNAVALAGIGVAVGVPLSLWAQRVAANIVTVPARTGLTGPFVLSTVVIVAVAIAASYFPARRASRVEPMQALRHD